MQIASGESMTTGNRHHVTGVEDNDFRRTRSGTLARPVYKPKRHVLGSSSRRGVTWKHFPHLINHIVREKKLRGTKSVYVSSVCVHPCTFRLELVNTHAR